MAPKKRCMFKRTKKGHFKFRKEGVKCAPSESTRKRHKKLFGDSGGKGHKAYAMTMYQERVKSMKKAREAKRQKRMVAKEDARFARYKTAGGMQG